MYDRAMPRVLIAVSGHGSVRRSLCVYVNPVATFLAHSKTNTKGLGRRRTPPVVLTSSLVIFNQNMLKVRGCAWRERENKKVTKRRLDFAELSELLFLGGRMVMSVASTALSLAVIDPSIDPILLVYTCAMSYWEFS
nr:hypothetical protein BgiMline_018017 [Biomphalaria glabrata]